MAEATRALSTPSEPANLTHIREEFIEKTGFIAQAEGLPRIAGRVFGLLLWEGEAISFGDLAERLQVSRGSISSATRLLEDKGLIRRVGRPGQRQDFFQLPDRPFVGMLATVAAGLDRARTEIETTLEALPEDQSGLRQRVESYAAFYKAIAEAVRASAKSL